MDESSSIKPMRVFLSYSSEQHTIAEQVYLAMTTSGHDVFFDRTDLPAGDEFNQAILDRIRTSDLMVFLISPEPVSEGAYTRTELRFARDTWPNPRDHVLPVMAVPMEFSDIPNYLKAVTVLRPEGNLTAEVSGKVNDIAAGRTPQDTIAGKAELIDEVSEKTEGLSRSLRVSEIDRQWAVENEKYGTSGQGKGFKPSKEMAIIFLVGCIAMSLFGYFAFTANNAGFFGWSPVILPLIFGVVSTIGFYVSAGNYRAAERKYRKRRLDAISGKNPISVDSPVFTDELDQSQSPDESPVFTDELDQSQSPDEYLRDLTNR